MKAVRDLMNVAREAGANGILNIQVLNLSLPSRNEKYVEAVAHGTAVLIDYDSD